MYTILDELFSLFHVYQLIMYMLQFWNSYLFVASLMTSIVLLSASITLYTRHHSQLAIAKITKYVTDATVLRDGVWVRLDSRNLVPGDIVKVQSDWLLPCDLLLIQGNQCGHPSQELEDFPDMIAAILQWTLIMRRLFNLPNIRFWSRFMYLQ
jgi:magnesium-transporting ATPase (P-type)